MERAETASVPSVDFFVSACWRVGGADTVHRCGTEYRESLRHASRLSEER